MKTETIYVTPSMARTWLNKNSKNRDLRPSHVEKLRLAFERGEYVMTHQGIAFADDGEVIDGQHRLTAISLLPDGMSFPMLVTTGLPRARAFAVIDTTQAIRNLSDVLGVDRRLAEVGMFLARVHMGRTQVTPTYAAPFVELARPAHDELMAWCSTTAKTWSSGPVRAAAVMSMMRGVDTDYVKLVYRALVQTDVQSMPPVVLSLFKSHIGGKVRASAAYDIYARAMKAFDPSKAELSKVLIKDASQEIASLRDFLDSAVSAQAAKKKAPSKAPVSVSRRYFSLLGNAA